MELCRTIAMMVSKDYRERMKAEFYQVNERTIRLREMLKAWDAGKLGFEPASPRHLLDAQLQAMQAYRDILKGRAAMEGVELDADEVEEGD